MLSADDQVAGRPVSVFVRLAGISRATFFALVPEHVPKHVKVGRNIVVTESPADWLARLPEGGAQTDRKNRWRGGPRRERRQK